MTKTTQLVIYGISIPIYLIAIVLTHTVYAELMLATSGIV